MESGAQTHRYGPDKTKGSNRAAAWRARNRQKPVAMIAPTRTRGRLARDIAHRTTSLEPSITPGEVALTPGAADAIKYILKRRSEAHRTLPGVERGAAANPTAPRGSGSEATEI